MKSRIKSIGFSLVMILCLGLIMGNINLQGVDAKTISKYYDNGNIKQTIQTKYFSNQQVKTYNLKDNLKYQLVTNFNQASQVTSKYKTKINYDVNYKELSKTLTTYKDYQYLNNKYQAKTVIIKYYPIDKNFKYYLSNKQTTTFNLSKKIKKQVINRLYKNNHLDKQIQTRMYKNYDISQIMSLYNNKGKLVYREKTSLNYDFHPIKFYW